MKRLSLVSPGLTLALTAPALAHNGKGSVRMTEAQLRESMRKLWEDHVTYTAFSCTAAISGGDDAGKLAERLLRNQDDIGNAVKPFYGEMAGNQLAALLRDHILVAADLAKAAKEGNASAPDEATKRWYRNADDISAFLAGANTPRPSEKERQ